MATSVQELLYEAIGSYMAGNGHDVETWSVLDRLQFTRRGRTSGYGMKNPQRLGAHVGTDVSAAKGGGEQSHTETWGSSDSEDLWLLPGNSVILGRFHWGLLTCWGWVRYLSRQTCCRELLFTRGFIQELCECPVISTWFYWCDPSLVLLWHGRGSVKTLFSCEVISVVG